jgi:hypothetical protein
MLYLFVDKIRSKYMPDVLNKEIPLHRALARSAEPQTVLKKGLTILNCDLELIRNARRILKSMKDVMLPMTVLRRLDCVLEPTKDKVLARQKALSGGKVKNVDPILCRVTGVPFYNTSRYSFEKLKGGPNNSAANLTNYIKGYEKIREEAEPINGKCGNEL